MNTLTGTLLLGWTAAAFAATSPENLSEPSDRVPIELYAGPVPKHIAAPDCSGLRLPRVCYDIKEGIEGWVELNFMVDPSGKPFEVTVLRSSGNKAFEESAARAIEASSFTPGTLNGTAIESDYAFKFTFTGNPPASGASEIFISKYRSLLKSINAGDQVSADNTRTKLKPANLYEDAYYGLAAYLYQKKWGNKQQQLDALLRALAEEQTATYLPREQFRAALQASLQLQIDLRYYAEATFSLKRLLKLGIDEKSKTQLTTLELQLRQLHDDDSRYAVQGEMPTGSWDIDLFKKHFHTQVNEGAVSQLKLRCSKKYVAFEFDPALDYQVDAKHGSCHLQLIGSPGTRFTLTQY